MSNGRHLRALLNGCLRKYLRTQAATVSCGHTSAKSAGCQFASCSAKGFSDALSNASLYLLTMIPLPVLYSPGPLSLPTYDGSTPLRPTMLLNRRGNNSTNLAKPSPVCCQSSPMIGRRTWPRDNTMNLACSYRSSVGSQFEATFGAAGSECVIQCAAEHMCTKSFHELRKGPPNALVVMIRLPTSVLGRPGIPGRHPGIRRAPPRANGRKIFCDVKHMLLDSAGIARSTQQDLHSRERCEACGDKS